MRKVPQANMRLSSDFVSTPFGLKQQHEILVSLLWARSAESDVPAQLHFCRGNSLCSWVVLELVLAHQSSQWLSLLLSWLTLSFPCLYVECLAVV